MTFLNFHIQVITILEITNEHASQSVEMHWLSLCVSWDVALVLMFPVTRASSSVSECWCHDVSSQMS